MAKFFVAGLGLFLFGLANVFSYMLTAIAPLHINPPFPFERVRVVSWSEGSFHYETYDPIYMVVHDPYRMVVDDPYWMAWSLILYAGIAIMIAATTTQKLKGKF